MSKSARALAFAAVIAMPGASDALAQAAVSKKMIEGTWLLVSADATNSAGGKEPLVVGGEAKGTLMFDANRFSFQIIGDFPKLASADRLKTIAEEDKHVTQGVLSYFGTYAVNEATGDLTFNVERSSFPNQNGGNTKRVITVLNADELRYHVPARLAGGSTIFVWKRAK